MILMLIPSSAASAITLSSNSVQMVSAGGSHTLMIRHGGTLWAWGAGQYGRLGDGDTSNHNVAVPTQIGTVSNWVYVAAGGLHSAAIDANGDLWTWGAAGQGQLGNGTTTDSGTPTIVSEPGPWRSVSAGARHTVAIKQDGTLWAWGENAQGAIGQNSGTGQYNVPMQVPALAGNTWLDASAGGYYDGGVTYGSFTVGIQSDGSLWTWGWNQSGQLGNGNTSNQTAPVQIVGVSTGDYNWASVSTGCWDTVAIKTDGTLWGWGGNGQYQLGLGVTGDQNTPQEISTDTNWQSASAGRYHTMAIRIDGTLWGWGQNDEGWLGNGTTATSQRPLQIGTDTNWVSVSAAWYHTAAVKDDGSLWTAGSNGAGQLGNNISGGGSGYDAGIDSSVFVLIQPSIALVTDPANTSVISGQSAGLSVTAIGSLTSGSLAYQWYSTPDGTVASGVPITDGTGTASTFTTPTLTDTTGLGTAYDYYVIVSDPNAGGANPVTSAVATVTVRQAETTASPVDLSTLTAGAWGAGWSFDGTVLTIDTGASVSLTGVASTGTRIVVQGTIPANVTFDNVTIPDPGNGNSPLTLESGAVLNLIETGTNSLTSDSSASAIAVPSDATLNISGDGILNANSTGGGVGIGGSTPAGVLTMSGSPIVYASGTDMTLQPPSSGILFNGTAGTVYGSPITTTDWTVPSGSALDIPAGASLTIGAGTALTNDGTINNSGTLINKGTITNNSGGSLINSGTIENEDSIVTDGTFTNTATGIVNNTGSGTITGTTAPTFAIMLDQTGTYTFSETAENYAAITPLTVTVTNTGNQETGALTVTRSGGASSNFTVSTSALSSISVDDGTGTGNNTSTFTVQSNTGLTAGVYTETITVAGNNGITAAFDVSFTVTTAGYGISLSETGTYTFAGAIENYITAPSLTVTAANTGNQATGALTLALSGADSTAFSLTPSSFTDIAVGADNTFTIAPNIGLASGTYTATVTVSGSNGITASFDISFTVTAATYGITLSDESTTPATILDGTTYTFPTLTSGYTATPLTVMVDNIGNQSTGMLTVTRSGGASSDFAVTQLVPSAALAVSGNGTFTVEPNAGLTAGTYTDTVTVTNGDNITTRFIVSFTVVDYGISLSQTGTYTFPSTVENYAPVTPLTVTVTNTGTQPTGALTVALTTGTDFTLNKTAISTLTVDGSDTFTLVPSDNLRADVYTDTVTISGGNGITASFDVGFTVTAATDGIALSPNTNQNFGTLAAGYTTAPTARTITVSNTGNQPTGDLIVGLSGTNSGSFTLSTSSIGSIDVNGSDSFTVVPNLGLAAGAYGATVTVSGESNIAAVSFDVSFTVTTGTGSTPPPIPIPPPPVPPVPDLPFLDIAGHWAEADGSIAFVYERDLMRGTSATTFAPNATLTRAMLVTILYRMEGEPEITFSQVFTDVASGKWYSDAMVWAAQSGLVQGIGNDYFAPETAVSREQIAVFLYRYAAFKGYYDAAPSLALETIFSDYHMVSSWAEEAMAWAVENRLIIGSGGKCMPLNAATRAECAALLSRFISHYAG